MKTNFYKIATLLLLAIFGLISCSKDDETPQPAQNKALLGLFDITINGSIEANLLFEDGNKVTYGFGTIYDMVAQPGRRATYTIDSNNLIKFSTTDGATTFNYKATYEPSTGKLLNGTYGLGTAFEGGGSFTGQKYNPNSTGFSLIKGYWVGKYNKISEKPFYAVFEENSQITTGADGPSLFIQAGSISKGNYIISGNTISGTCTYLEGAGSYSFTGMYDAATKKITGTYGFGSNTSGEGTFFLENKNHN